MLNFKNILHIMDLFKKKKSNEASFSFVRLTLNGSKIFPPSLLLGIISLYLGSHLVENFISIEYY